MTGLLSTDDTVDGLEILLCPVNGDDERHGPHTWVSPTYVGHGDYREDEYRCPGVGLVTVSWSELDTFRQCPMKHRLAYLERWQKEADDTSALGKGSAWHRVMEAHYGTIKAHQVTIEDAPHGSPTGVAWDCSAEDLEQACLDAVADVIREMRDVEERNPELIQLLQWMYVGHLERYGLDEDWDILAVETTAVVPLYEPDGSESWVRLKVKIDLLVRDSRGRVWLVDHKSCGSLPTDKDFDWADQFGLYVYALRHIGMKITGSLHSAAKTKMNKGDLIKPGEPGYKATMKEQTLDDRYSRTPMNYTEAQLDCIAADALADFKLAHGEHNHKRRNPSEDMCKWRCGFAEACMFGRRTDSDANMLDMLQRTGFAQEPIRH